MLTGWHTARFVVSGIADKNTVTKLAVFVGNVSQVLFKDVLVTSNAIRFLKARQAYGLLTVECL